MKILKREARKELLGSCRFSRRSKADNPRDMPDDRLRRTESHKQGIKRCVVIALCEATVAFGDEEWDVAVDGMRQAEQVLKVDLLRGRT